MAAGKLMKLQVINGNTTTNCKVSRVTMPLKAQALDVTNSQSSGKGEYEVGVVDGDCSFSIVYQLADTPVNILDPAGSGNPYTVRFYPSYAAANTAYMSGSLVVESCEIRSEVRGIITADVSGKFTGGYTNNSNLM